MYSEEHHHLKWEIDNFKIKLVTFIINFGRNNIIRNRQMQVLKRGFGIRGISFIKLELWRVYLSYHSVKNKFIKDTSFRYLITVLSLGGGGGQHLLPILKGY